MPHLVSSIPSRVFAGVVLALLATGCREVAPPLIPELQASGLVGQWKTAPQNLSPQGWMQYEKTFDARGRFTDRVRTYGLYPGQARNTLSAYHEGVGTYRIEGDRLFFRQERLSDWDSFYGANSPVRTTKLTGADGASEGMTFVLDGDVLTFHYLSYPADAPVPTTARFTRSR